MIASSRNEDQQLRELRRKRIKYSYLRLIIFSTLLFSYCGSASTDEHFNIPVLTDWSEIRSAQAKKHTLLVLLVEQSDCHYCDTIKRDFIGPALTLDAYGEEVIYRRLSIDPDLLIRFNGKGISTRDFVKKFDAVYAPTVLFLGPKQNTLADNLVGISNPDYYGHYFEKSIIDSLEQLKIAR